MRPINVAPTQEEEFAQAQRVDMGRPGETLPGYSGDYPNVDLVGDGPTARLMNYYTSNQTR